MDDTVCRYAVDHRDHPFVLRHLIVDAPDYGSELERQPAGTDEDVRLTRAEGLALHAEPGEVVARRRRGHELDGTARRPERHRPEGVGARGVDRPVDEVVSCRVQGVRYV